MHRLAALGLVVVAACSVDGSSSSTGEDGGSGGGGSPGSASTLSVRVANTFLSSGTTGAALDIYDDLGDGPSASAKPIIANLAYGAISAYVTPRLDPRLGPNVTLTALPAGTSPTDMTDAQTAWASADDGSHEQATVLLDYESTLPGTPLSGMSFSSFVEKGDDGQGSSGPLAPSPPSGQGEYLASTAPIDNGTSLHSSGGYYLLVDDSCTPPLNGDPNAPGLPDLFAADGVAPLSSFALFAAAPGAHTISVVAWDDVDTPMCSQLPAAGQATTTVTIAAGQQILTFVYGSSLTALHLLTAPIAP